jgi:hypothetical protein
MRRTHASLCRQAGIDPKLVADQLGHGLGVNLDVYTVAGLDQRRQQAVQALEELVPIASATAAIAATAEVFFDHRSGFIDGQGSTRELGAIHLGDCLVGALLRHLYKTESLGTACITVGDDLNRFDSSALFKGASDIALCRLERQISNKQFFRHFIYLICKGTSRA